MPTSAWTSGTAPTRSSATATRCTAPTSSTIGATRRWAAPGVTSTSPRSAARRHGKTRPRAIRRPRRTRGGTGTTSTVTASRRRHSWLGPGCGAHGQGRYGQPGEDNRRDDAGDVQAGGERLPRGMKQFRALAGGKVPAGGAGAGQRVGRAVHPAAVDTAATTPSNAKRQGARTVGAGP